MGVEQWRDISGYEGLYQVSNQGRIKALAKVDSGGKYWPEKIVKPIRQHSGYLHVGLWWGGKCKQSRIHRLVAQAFLPNPENKTHVNHLNEKRTITALKIFNGLRLKKTLIMAHVLRKGQGRKVKK